MIHTPNPFDFCTNLAEGVSLRKIAHKHEYLMFSGPCFFVEMQRRETLHQESDFVDLGDDER